MVRQSCAFKRGSDFAKACRRRVRASRSCALRIALALADKSATEALAARLAAAARSRDVFALRGDLGTGKTVFARAFIRARTRRDEEVPSPTFTLVQTYEPAPLTEPAIWHYDLFRLQNADDALELDIEEAFCGAISLIEWPERLGIGYPIDGST